MATDWIEDELGADDREIVREQLAVAFGVADLDDEATTKPTPATRQRMLELRSAAAIRSAAEKLGVDPIGLAERLDLVVVHEALKACFTDLMIAQGNMRDAARHDDRWAGCADKIAPSVDAGRAALSLFGEPS